MKNIEIIIISILFLFVSLINLDFLGYLGFSQTRLTFEFTKTIFFNIVLSFLMIFFVLKNFRKKINIPKIIFIIFILFLFSVFTSTYPLTNIFGNSLNGHGLIFLTNLVFLFLILINLEKNKIEKLFKYITLFSPIILILGILEYISNGEIIKLGFLSSTSYFNLFCLLITPYILKKIYFFKYQNFKNGNKILLKNTKLSKNKFYNYFCFFVLFLISISLFLSKFIFSIIIFIFYIIYFIVKNFNPKNKNIFIFAGFLSILTIFLFSDYSIKEEINAIISKMLVWKSTYNAISGNVDSAFFGVGNDSLIYVFEAYKTKFLYIFEHLGFIIDKPNNFVLEIFYSFGILGIILLFNCLYNFSCSYKNSAFHHIILIFLIFSFFNFISIVNYFLLIIAISLVYLKNEKDEIFFKTKIFLIIVSITSILLSFMYYIEESKYLENKNFTENIIYKNLISENKEDNIIKNNNDIFKICEDLLKINKSAENFFYCGNFYWEIGYESLAKVYYQNGLNRIPDVWNENSKYFNNIFIKYFFDKEKFFNENHSNIKEILERLNIKIGKNT